jgi:hypothetical protein
MRYQTVHTATDTQQHKYFLVDDVVVGGYTLVLTRVTVPVLHITKTSYYSMCNNTCRSSYFLGLLCLYVETKQLKVRTAGPSLRIALFSRRIVLTNTVITVY